MDLETVRFVPKVHPASRLIEPDDPLSCHATAVPGDPDLMFRGIVEEFCRMGWDVEHILALFRDPNYPMLYGLGLAFGMDGMRERVQALARFHGLFSVRATVVEAPEEESDDDHEHDHDHGPELVQIGLNGLGGCQHGYGL